MYEISQPAISCFCEEYNLWIVFLHDQGCQKSIKNRSQTIQFKCSKKVCRKHEKCFQTDPKWEPKSIQILQKTKFKNVLVFWIDFRRPLVPILLAKWSPTRRTSSRKPNKKGKELEGNSRGQSSNPNTPAALGGTPGPERILGTFSAPCSWKKAIRNGFWIDI